MSKHLIIGGVHKAGTTSLYTYLSWHPQVKASTIKETHFFSDNRFAKKHDTYLNYFTGDLTNKVLIEASPEYIYGKEETASRIKKNLSEVKLIFILRNPSDKIVSSFKHRKKNLFFDKDYTFSDFYFDYLQIENLNKIVDDSTLNVYTRELIDGNYVECLKPWYNIFNQDQIRVLFFDDLKQSPRSMVADICNWIGVNGDFYDDKEFTVENKSVEFKNKQLQKLTMKLAKNLEPIIRKNYRLKKTLRNIYYSINEKKGPSPDLDYGILQKLDNLYKEKNQELRNLLMEKGYTNFPQWL